MHYPYTLKNNIYHSNRRNLFKQTETTTIFSFGYRSCAWPRSGLFSWQKPCSGCNSGIDLVVALEHTFFQPCWNTKQISRFTKFRKTTLRICKPSYCCSNQSYVAFLLDKLCSKWPGSCFLHLFVLNDSAFA